ncbi:leucine-rich repeat-containing protein [Tanacetum coccineum]
MVEITEAEETQPLISQKQQQEQSSSPTTKRVTTKVPEITIHLYKSGKGPIDIFTSSLGGWERDQLEVGDILEKYGLKSLYAFNKSEKTRGVPIRFNPKNGRSVLTYKDGSIVSLDGDPKERDQLKVGDILDKYGLKSLYAFSKGEKTRGVPIRFNPKNGRSVLTYKDGSVVSLDGDPNILDTLLSSLTNLEYLHLSYNGFSLTTNNANHYVNPGFMSLKLASCKLKVFPESFRAMKQLQELDLSGNEIHGQIPHWAGEIGRNELYRLNLSHNFITGLPQYQFNLIEGPFPPSICNMNNLYYLDMSHNSFDGVIPQCVVNITLTMMDLGNIAVKEQFQMYSRNSYN